MKYLEEKDQARAFIFFTMAADHGMLLGNFGLALLYFRNNENQKASSTSDTMVTITMEEHDILRGTGFRGDFASATFEFDYVEEGAIHYD